MNTRVRNGKIARLPLALREELNTRLECSEDGSDLLPWLNGLPEVQAILRDKFGGALINKQNLSDWRQGGFQEWLARRSLAEEARELAQLSGQLETDTQCVLADAAAAVVAARLGTLVAHWDGEVDEAFEARTRILSRLGRSVTQLQRQAHQAAREQFDLEQLRAARDKALLEEKIEKLLQPLSDRRDESCMANAWGGGPGGLKMARYAAAVRSGDLEAKLDLLPTDTFAEVDSEDDDDEDEDDDWKDEDDDELEEDAEDLEDDDDDEELEEEEGEESEGESSSVKVCSKRKSGGKG